MRYIKLYENFDSFYGADKLTPLFAILLRVDDDFGDLSEVVELGKKLVTFLDSKGVEFRTYYAEEGDERIKDDEGLIPDDNILLFLFNKDIEAEGIDINSIMPSGDATSPKLSFEDIDLKDIPKNIEIIRIPDNDIEFYITAKKYNL